MFISFEGIEGCGKSTQARRLRDNLIDSGYQVKLTREPGEGEFGKRIREILLNTSNTSIQPLTELFLLLADRTQHVHDTVSPLLKQDVIVISDRYTDSSLAYQGLGRGIPEEIIESLNTMATQGVMPDITFLLDLDVKAGLARSRNRLAQLKLFDSEGRFEMEAIEFHVRVRERYLYLAQREPNRFRVLDASLAIEAIADSIWNEVNQVFRGESQISVYD